MILIKIYRYAVLHHAIVDQEFYLAVISALIEIEVLKTENKGVERRH